MAEGSYRLAESHRLAQSRLGAETANLMRVAWPLLSMANIDGTEPRWLRAVVPIVAAQHRRSARMAADYVFAARTLDLGIDPAYIPVQAVVDVAQITASLHVTGPVEVKRLTAAGHSMPDIRQTAFVTMTRSAERLAMAGGRDSISASVAADEQALGWARVTSGNSCAFCSMLASRGPVYSEGSVSFQAHDGCHCGEMSVYRREHGWTPQAREFRDIWNDTTQGLGGADALNAFRRSVEAA